MWRKFLSCATFCQALVTIDLEITTSIQSSRCEYCGDKLDRGDFPRKCILSNIADSKYFDRRFGLCCRRDGCRKRALPPSTRFFVKTQLPLPLFLIAALLSASYKSKIVSRLASIFRVTESTIRRWRRLFRKSPAFQAILAKIKARIPGLGAQTYSITRFFLQCRNSKSMICSVILELLSLCINVDFGMINKGKLPSAEFSGCKLTPFRC